MTTPWPIRAGWKRCWRTRKRHPRIGMFASEVRLAGTGKLDSAGMLIACRWIQQTSVSDRIWQTRTTLLPSGSAALYRRAMLEEIGLFDESFFLYCEDTDLGLRAQWAGWGCRYVPGAIVEHRYSHSAGRASPLKAYYVERNRLYTIVKNFPARMLWAAPFASVARYFWHVAALVVRARQNGGISAGGPLGGDAAVAGDPRPPRRIVSFAGSAGRPASHPSHAANHAQAEFRALLERHSITVRQVAAL